MAGSPGGHEVERISVKVVPDTSDFHKKLKAFLDKEEKDTKLSIDVELDTKKAEAQLKKLAQNLTVTLKVNIDAAGVKAKLDALSKNQTVKIRADVDDAAAKVKFKTLTTSKNIDIKAEVDDLAAKVKLDLLARDRKVNIKADVDKSATSRIGGIFSKIGSLASSVGSTIGSALSGGFNQASSTATGVVGAVSKIGSSLGSIGAVATAVFWAVIIPAIVGAIVAAAALAGALLLVFVPAAFIAAGVAFDLLTAKGKGTAAKLKSAFKDVAKTAKGVITDAVQPMTKAIAAQLPKLDKWIKTLKGPLKSAFSDSSKFLDDFRLAFQGFISNTLKGMVDALKNPAVKPAIDGFKKMMQDIGTAIGLFFLVLANGGVDFGKTMTALGEAFKQMMPALAGLLNAFAVVSPDLIKRMGDGITQILHAFSDPATVSALATIAGLSFDVIIASLKFIAFILPAIVIGTQETWAYIVTAWNAIWAFLATVFGAIGKAASATWNYITREVTNAAHATSSVVTAVWHGISAATSATWNAMKATVSAVSNAIVSVVTGAWHGLTSATSSTINGIKSFFSSLGSFVTRVVNDIRNSIDWIIGKAQSAARFLSNLNPFGADSTIAVEDDTKGAGRPPFDPGFPPVGPMPLGGLFNFQADLNGMQSAARSLNNTAFSSASKNTGVSTGVAGLAQKVYQFGDIIADDKPTPDAIIKALSYADALYGN